MDDILGTRNNFRSLSIKDLLEARDLYHFHLLNKANVVGTAIGLYLIRHTDPTPEEEARQAADEVREQLRQQRGGSGDTRFERESRPDRKVPRTFANSGVRNYSWPCVLALVKKWQYESDFGTAAGELHPEELVPKTLYLPDGRMVPVCVVQVEQAEPERTLVPDWHWPASRYGPGMPIVVSTQERERRATIGCLVSDGHTTYALTSRHVCGPKGERVFTMADGRPVEIGHSSGQTLTRLPFEEIYPEFRSRRTDVNLDVGLIEVGDVNDWTSQTFGFGATGALADLNEVNISLRLIDAPVVAAGAASGRLEGRIKALFYRYKSVGGYDYVADFLIAPRDPAQERIEREIAEGRSTTESRDAERALAESDRRAAPPPHTQPGDSGAVWHLVVPRERADGNGRKPGDATADPFDGDLRPIATEWGGQVFADGAKQSRYAFALATSLTTVCRKLDVELVLEHDVGVLPYWGQTGHYSIASFATGAVQNARLRGFLGENLDQISFGIEKLTARDIAAALKAAKEEGGLVPLADVPDIVWKTFHTKPGGRDTQAAGQGRTSGPEHPTHYADIDQPRPSDGTTLRALCMADAANINVQTWQQFYDECGHEASRERGLLPFRVWQFFDAMEDFASQGDAASFLCAAGLVSHYVGDACQPLHGSMYADGYADQETTVVHHSRDTGEAKEEKSHVGAGVHSTYESKMIDRKAKEIVDGLDAAVAALPALAPITSGLEAAKAIVELMDRTAGRIPPTDLVDAFVAAGGKPTVAVQDALWEQFGDATMAVMADGARVLAAIWDGAWKAGNGDVISAAALTRIPAKSLVARYRRRDFVPSLDLDAIGTVLKQPANI